MPAERHAGPKVGPGRGSEELSSSVSCRSRVSVFTGQVPASSCTQAQAGLSAWWFPPVVRQQRSPPGRSSREGQGQYGSEEQAEGAWKGHACSLKVPQDGTIGLPLSRRKGHFIDEWVCKPDQNQSTCFKHAPVFI